MVGMANGLDAKYVTCKTLPAVTIITITTLIPPTHAHSLTHSLTHSRTHTHTHTHTPLTQSLTHTITHSHTHHSHHSHNHSLTQSLTPLTQSLTPLTQSLTPPRRSRVGGRPITGKALTSAWVRVRVGVRRGLVRFRFRGWLAQWICNSEEKMNALMQTHTYAHTHTHSHTHTLAYAHVCPFTRTPGCGRICFQKVNFSFLPLAGA